MSGRRGLRAVVRAALVAVAAAGALGGGASAQTPTMPSTLRYGSGLIDVPVSSVLPHGAITGTLSGFFMSLAQRAEVDDRGATASLGPGIDEFYSDASLAVGLFDRVEMGVSLQAFGEPDTGGDVWGAFGRLRLWEPIDQGLGLAVGGRYLTSPSFGDGRDYQPGRLGFPDERLRSEYVALDDVHTNLSLYGVATAYVRGFDGGPLPPNDMTFTLGYGTGMFGGPGELDFYSPGHANGWFVGSSVNLDVSASSMLTVMAEHNGFDVNVGAQFDWRGYRVGVQYLASNHDWPSDGYSSEYRKPKLGVLGSIAICPGRRGWACTPRAMARVEPDTIRIPPPPPDTVVVEVGAVPRPVGTESTLCLSTGENIPIRLTADGDTLVGPNWISTRAMGPNLSFAGAYAGGSFWYRAGGSILFEGASFERSDEAFPIDCAQILRVGTHEGVPVFAVLAASRPLQVLFIPVRAGLWHRYERSPRRPE